MNLLATAFLLLLLVWPLQVWPAANPNLIVDDGLQGVTCRHYAKAANLHWSRPGGDWRDARERDFGPDPFAVASVSRRGGVQSVEWDVTGLVQRWAQSTRAWPAVHIHAPPGKPGSAVQLFSREHSIASERPALELTWSDGARARYEAVADANFPCPHFRSGGDSPVLRAGGSSSALVQFHFAPRLGYTVQRARLVMSIARRSPANTELGIFQAMLPGLGKEEVVQGLAASFPDDIGLERHPDVWVVERFEGRSKHPDWLGSADAKRTRFVQTDRANGFAELQGRALGVTLAEGEKQALNSHIRLKQFAGREPEEAFFRYYIRLGENWSPTADGGKLPGLAGTYGRGGWGGRQSDGQNGWSARGAFFRQTVPPSVVADLRALGSYVYHAGAEGQYGSTWGWNLWPTGFLQRNRWYSVEQHVRLNTLGQADGVLRTWIDGQLVFEMSDIRYRDTDQLAIESVWMNVYHGGTAKSPRDMTLYVDNLVVAARYIGPAVWRNARVGN